MEHELGATRPEDLLGSLSWVQTLARSLVGDGAADDLVQETWIAASRRREDGPPPRKWISTVLVNLARQRARRDASRRVREERRAVPDDLPSSAELVLRMERQRLVVDAVTRLDEPFRSTVILHFNEGLTSAEIARRQGVRR